MRFRVTVEVEADTLESAIDNVISANANALRYVDATEESCPSIRHFQLSRLYELGEDGGFHRDAWHYVMAHWEWKMQENSAHSRLKMCQWCGYVHREEDVLHLKDKAPEVALRSGFFGFDVCNQCRESAQLFLEEESEIKRAKSLLNRLRPVMRGRIIRWDEIEAEYRAGIRSMRSISIEFGVSRAGIIKRAKRDRWAVGKEILFACLDEQEIFNAKANSEPSALWLADFLEQCIYDTQNKVLHADKAKAIAELAELNIKILQHDLNHAVLSRRNKWHLTK